MHLRLWLRTPLHLSFIKPLRRTLSTVADAPSTPQQPTLARTTKPEHHIQILEPFNAAPVPDQIFDVLFIGGDAFSCVTLRKLHEAKDVWRSIQVMTKRDTMVKIRGKPTLIESPVKLAATELGIPVHFAPKDGDMKDMQFPVPFARVGKYHSENHLMVVSSFGRFIPWKKLKNFRPSRRLNLHPSLVPKYRGASPIQYAIADDCKETGVSIIEVERVGLGYDKGNIWAQKVVPMVEKPTYGSMWPILAEEGSDLMVKVLRDMIAGEQPTSIPQNLYEGSLAPAIDSLFARVDWWQSTASRIEACQRAIMHQTNVFTYIWRKETLQLYDLRVLPPSEHSQSLQFPGQAALNKQTGELQVQCANGTQLGVRSVKQQYRNLIPAAEWWKGVTAERKVRGSEGKLVQFNMGTGAVEGIHPEVQYGGFTEETILDAALSME